MNFIIRLLISAFVAYGLSIILEPHVRIDTFVTALVFVMALGLLNAIVKPILVILTLPITILTLGIFLLILNVLMVILAGKWVNGIYIDGFWWALVFGFLLSFISSALSGLGKK
ncbi:MAG: phage holin family protein [Ginsengibacter sp.]